MSNPRNPFPAVDVVILQNNKVVLIERKNEPLGFALPGGFVEYGESVEDAARREILEETNLELDNLLLFSVYSDPNRDPRFHVISIVFLATSTGTPVASDDASTVGLFEIENLPTPMVFDHNKIINDVITIRRKIFESLLSQTSI